jgi:hypothetical protein
MTRLTVADLHATLADERHLGWGYACTSDITSTYKRAALDRAIVGVANEEGLTAEELFQWSNSKWGRWLTDDIIGRDGQPSRATVRRYITRAILDDLIAEVA